MKVTLPSDTNTTRLYLEEEMGDHYDPPGPPVMTDWEHGVKYLRVRKEVGERLLERGNVRAYEAVIENGQPDDTGQS